MKIKNINDKKNMYKVTTLHIITTEGLRKVIVLGISVEIEEGIFKELPNYNILEGNRSYC